MLNTGSHSKAYPWLTYTLWIAETVDVPLPETHYGCSFYSESCVEEATCEDLVESGEWKCNCALGASGDGQKGVNHTGCRYR